MGVIGGEGVERRFRGFEIEGNDVERKGRCIGNFDSRALVILA